MTDYQKELAKAVAALLGGAEDWAAADAIKALLKELEEYRERYGSPAEQACLTDPQKKLLRGEASKRRKQAEQYKVYKQDKGSNAALADAIDAALKEVEGAAALVAYLQKHPHDPVADYGVRLYYSYLKPPEAVR